MIKDNFQYPILFITKISKTAASIKITSKRIRTISNSGFTLLEILVAVMIFGIVMLTLFSSLRSFMLSSQMIKTNIAASEAAASVNKIMERDFLNLRISMAPEYSKNEAESGIDSIKGTRSSFSGTASQDKRDKFRFIGDETTEGGNVFSRVRFASLNHIQFGDDAALINEEAAVKKAGVATIIYYVRPNDQNGFDLCRSDTLNQFDDIEPSGCDPIICKNITKFKVAYMDIKDEEHSNWDSESDAADYATPVSVLINLEFYIIDSIRTFSTCISMPVFRIE